MIELYNNIQDVSFDVPITVFCVSYFGLVFFFSSCTVSLGHKIINISLSILGSLLPFSI